MGVNAPPAQSSRDGFFTQLPERFQRVFLPGSTTVRKCGMVGKDSVEVGAKERAASSSSWSTMKKRNTRRRPSNALFHIDDDHELAIRRPSARVYN